MTEDQIMRLADAYAAAYSEYENECNSHDSDLRYISELQLVRDEARDALEAAVLAQGDMSPASTHGKNVSMKRGFENMNEAKQEPVAQGEPRIYGAVELAQMQQRGRDMHTRPAPVNQQLLEQFELVLRNLDKGMSKSIQKLVARESREVLAAIASAKGKI